MSLVPILLVGFVIALMALILVSLRRNSRMIEAFDEPELGELSACFSDWRVEWAKKELSKRGWRFVNSNPAPEYRGKTVMLFHKTESGEPIKSILHFLNRKLQLPVGKWKLSRGPNGDVE